MSRKKSLLKKTKSGLVENKPIPRKSNKTMIIEKLVEAVKKGDLNEQVKYRRLLKGA